MKMKLILHPVSGDFSSDFKVHLIISEPVNQQAFVLEQPGGAPSDPTCGELKGQKHRHSTCVCV